MGRKGPANTSQPCRNPPDPGAQLSPSACIEPGSKT